MKRLSDEDILAGLRKRDNRVLQYIYKNSFNPVRQLILSNAGSDSDAAPGALSGHPKPGRFIALFSLVGLLLPLAILVVGWNPLVETADRFVSWVLSLIDQFAQLLEELSVPEAPLEEIPKEPPELPDVAPVG